jgi:hypothetical protein
VNNETVQLNKQLNAMELERAQLDLEIAERKVARARLDMKIATVNRQLIGSEHVAPPPPPLPAPVPPAPADGDPVHIDLSTLPDSAMLKSAEVAAILRVNPDTLAWWRKHKPDHPLRWVRVRTGCALLSRHGALFLDGAHRSTMLSGCCQHDEEAGCVCFSGFSLCLSTN